MCTPNLYQTKKNTLRIVLSLFHGAAFYIRRHGREELSTRTSQSQSCRLLQCCACGSYSPINKFFKFIVNLIVKDTKNNRVFAQPPIPLGVSPQSLVFVAQPIYLRSRVAPDISPSVIILAVCVGLGQRRQGHGVSPMPWARSAARYPRRNAERNIGCTVSCALCP